VSGSSESRETASASTTTRAIAPLSIAVSGLIPAVSLAQPIQDPAAGWDELWNKVLIDITILGILFALVTLYFMVKYRRRHPDETGRASKLSVGMAIGWVVIPVFAFMADDFFLAAKGWQLWNTYRDVPAERLEIQLTSGMYSWHFTYPNGVETHNLLPVPAGTPVLVRMTSRDVVHSMFIPDYRVKEDSMPGRVTYLWFYPQTPGESIISCAEYCGIMHSYMVGKLKVLSKDEFDSWYEREGAKVAKQEAIAVEGGA